MVHGPGIGGETPSLALMVAALLTGHDKPDHSLLSGANRSLKKQDQHMEPVAKRRCNVSVDGRLG